MALTARLATQICEATAWQIRHTQICEANNLGCLIYSMGRQLFGIEATECMWDQSHVHL